MCRHTAIYALIAEADLILLYVCPYTSIYTCRHNVIYALIAEADLILLYVCPHTTIVCVHILRHVSSYYYICPHSTKCVSTYYWMCPHTGIYYIHVLPQANGLSKANIEIKKTLYVCPHTDMYCTNVVCRRQIDYQMLRFSTICHHTTTYVSAYYYMCPHTTIYVSSYYSIRVLILLCICREGDYQRLWYQGIYVSLVYCYVS